MQLAPNPTFRNNFLPHKRKNSRVCVATVVNDIDPEMPKLEVCNHSYRNRNRKRFKGIPLCERHSKSYRMRSGAQKQVATKEAIMEMLNL